MRGWTTVRDLKGRLQREWERGRLLAAQLTGETNFPLRVPLKHPRSRDIVDGYGDVKEWIDGLVRHSRSGKGRGYELEWREINHRQLGRNRIPVAAVFEEQIDALALIGRQREADSFRTLCRTVLGGFPGLRPWLEKAPLLALSHAGHWQKIEAVLRWLQAHPRPNIYIRQMEIPGVDTKFIEQHKKLLCELLDLVLPADAIDQCARGVSFFERRYGFLSKPAQIRFRLLDPALYIQGLSDLHIPAHDLSGLDLQVRKVFVTENEINGLCFPNLERSMVIFGLGYGLDRLAEAGWLHRKEIYYWGDIDTHGFAMLDQFRSYFPEAHSMLMDQETLMDHRLLWGQEQSPMNRDLKRLNPAESALYDDLRRNRWAEALRLEQERISFTHLKTALENLYLSCPPIFAR